MENIQDEKTQQCCSSVDFYKMEKELKHLSTYEYVLRNTRRVNVFKFIDALMLLNKTYGTQKTKDLFMFLINEGKVFKVEEIAPGCVDMSIKRSLTSSDLFIWDKEDNSFIYKILGCMAIISVCMLGMFRVFPMWHRYLLYYLRYPILAFFLFMMVAAVVRCVVYLITLFFYEEQCWIWPNLFADCGFFESFKPMYVWTTNNKEKEEETKTE